ECRSSLHPPIIEEDPHRPYAAESQKDVYEISDFDHRSASRYKTPDCPNHDHNEPRCPEDPKASTFDSETPPESADDRPNPDGDQSGPDASDLNVVKAHHEKDYGNDYDDPTGPG